MDRIGEPDLGSPSFKADPYEHFALLRQASPVHRVRLRNGTIAWLVTRYEDGVAVLANTQFAKDPLRAKADQGSKPPWLPAPLRALSRTMLDLDGADHRRLRGLVQNARQPDREWHARASGEPRADGAAAKRAATGSGPLAAFIRGAAGCSQRHLSGRSVYDIVHGLTIGRVIKRLGGNECAAV